MTGRDPLTPGEPLHTGLDSSAFNAEFSLGQSVTVSRAFTQEDFRRFAELSGDDNPIHVDPAYAARTHFGRVVAHGMLLLSAVSGVIGEVLSGSAHVPLEHELMFPAPTYPDEEVRLHVQINGFPEPGQIKLTTHVFRPDGEIGLQGTARVRLTAVQPHRSSAAPGAADPAQAKERAGNGSMEGIRLGDEASLRRAFRKEELLDFIDLAQDRNPVYTVPEMARSLGLEEPPLPAGLVGGLFSDLLGTQLPGRGTNYLKQRLRFHAAAHPGEELLAGVTVSRLRPEKRLINLETRCLTGAGVMVWDGEALVLVPTSDSP